MAAITNTHVTSGGRMPADKDSSAFFKALIENTSDIIGVLDESGTIRYLGSSATVKIGYTSEELIGTSLLEIIRPDDAPRLSEVLKELLKSPVGSVDTQLCIAHKNGFDVLLMESSFKNLLKDSAVEGIILTMRDITARKKSEDALHQSEARYRTVAETASDAIVTVDHNSTILFANKSTEKIFGFRIEELVGNNLNIIMPEYLRSLHAEGMNRHIQTGIRHIPWNAVEVPGLHKDGREIPLEISFGKFIDNGHHIFTGIIRDVSERKRAESELALRENAIDMASEGIMITDARFPDNPLVYVNRGFEQITGYTKEEVIGRSGIFLEGPDTDLDTAAGIYEIIRSRQAGKVEILNYKKDGTPFWNLLSLTPLLNAEGVVTNYIAVQTDITERKRQEEQVRKAFEKEKELGEMKSHFITTASHEFRTPLSAIISSAEILEYYSEKLSRERQLMHLKKIQGAAKNITDILQEILAYNKAETGKFIWKPRDVNFTVVCQEIIDDISLQYENKCTVIFKNSAGTDTAILDYDLFKITIEAIISNAVKFSHASGTIRLNIVLKENALVCTIEDDGIGIPAQDIELITEPFHRGTNAGNIPGAGLGLALVKRVIGIQHATLHIMSEPGRGTQVTLTFPQKKDQ